MSSQGFLWRKSIYAYACFLRFRIKCSLPSALANTIWLQSRCLQREICFSRRELEK